MKSEKKQLAMIFMLLAVLVIVPTVCMMWFVVRAAQNEQFALKQRMIYSYENELSDFFGGDLFSEIDAEIRKADSLLAKRYGENKAMSQQVFDMGGTIFENVVLYGSSEGTASNENYLYDELPEAFDKAEQLEFQQDEPLLAADEYRKIVEEGKDDTVQAAYFGLARCLRKAGNLKDAIDVCRDVLEQQDGVFDRGQVQYWQLKMLLVEMYSQTGRAELSDTITELIECVEEMVPYSLKHLVLTKAMNLIEKNELTDKLAEQYETAKSEKEFVEKNILFTDSLERIRNDGGIYFKRLEVAELDDVYYGCVGLSMVDKKYFACWFLSEGKMKKIIEDRVSSFEDDMVTINVYDNQDVLIVGSENEDAKVGSILERQMQPDTILTEKATGGRFENWNIWAAFRPSVFGYAADKYKMAYIWTAVLVLVFAGAAAIIVGRMLLSQARINRLKNDFIATVTHELKTPLTSTRMLVDTLLDGKYEDSATVCEYLQIISSENLRLNSLIDNFLTFSRMERSKEVFEKKKIAVNELLSEAGAVFCKKEDKKLIFSVTKCEAESLILVDKQAMLTVILNLLSNAWKYTEKETKEIALRAYTEKNGDVCIAVKDNGIGLSTRQQKKVFDRFYRVDNSLARSAEGTGIGLTIVKFIVEAHGGKIEVKSRPGIGSEFIVRLAGMS